MATDGVQQKSGDHDDVDADIVDALIEPDEPSDAGSPAVGTDHRPVVEESSGSEPNALVDDAAPGDTVTLGVDDPFKPEPRPVLFTGPASDDTVLEMRQVAGLTAGSMMKLTLGRAFEFNESNEGGSFSLRVLETGEVLVHPGSAKAVVDEIDVTEPTLIGDAILNVSSACFSVRPPRPPASNDTRMEAINATFAAAPAIAVPPLGSEEPLSPEQLAGSRLGTLINRNPLTKGMVGRRAWDFLQSIRETRSVVAERHRLMHPDPEELKTRLSRLDPGLWERGRDHPLFARFSVAYATIPWEPRFDNPELIPEILHEPIVDMSLLPWVPVTANLLYGPLAIVGRRAARLAACRHAVLSLAALSVPGDVKFSIRADRTKSSSWNWCRALPPVMATGSNGETSREVGYEVLIIDGDESLEAVTAGLSERASPAATIDDDPDTLDVADTHPADGGLIILAESIEDVDVPCGTVLQIHPNGTGAITNHLNETIQVTPIGATEAFAHDMATRVADILTDSFL